MLTAKQFATETGISYPVVIEWLREGKIPEAEQTSFKVWQIPATIAEIFKKPENRPKLGRPTFGERLKTIAAEILEEVSNQYAEFIVHPQAQDSNDWDLTFTAHDGSEDRVRVIRLSGQTDDEVKGQIRAQLGIADDQEPTKPGRSPSKKSTKKTKG